MEETYSGVGKCVDRTNHRALAEFRNAYHGGEQIPDTVALYVRKCVIWTTLVRGGGLEISANVEGVKPEHTIGVFSRYVRRSKGRFTLKHEEVIR